MLSDFCCGCFRIVQACHPYIRLSAMWHPRTLLLWYCSKLYQDLIYAMDYLAINRGKNGKKYVDGKDGGERHQWNAEEMTNAWKSR